MTDRVLIPVNGIWLALTTEQFAEAQVAAQGLAPAAASVATHGPAGEFLTAEQLEQRTGVAASWFEQAARENRIPCRRLGRYTRFVFAEVEQACRPLDTDSLSGVRAWRGSRG